MPSFAELFGREPEASAEAHGRVNLLGEHTDYNEGYVLPTLVPQRTRVELSRSAAPQHAVYSANLDERSDFGADAPRGFARYVHGCIAVLEQRGDPVPALCIRISSDVPLGAGLSSSAALEVAVLAALRALLQLAYDDVELARLAQRAESEHVGVRCGILDPLACSLGVEGHMLFIDTRTLERRLLPLPPAAELVVLDSGIERTLAATAYNERRRECESAARLLGVRALRDVDDARLASRLPAPLDRRARHVICENARVLEAAAGVDARRFGALMNASHASLRDDYAVSVPALDALVELLQAHPQVHGARLTGAGFGGACVALSRTGSGRGVAREVLQRYERLGHRGVALV